jgi:hypothetical protein
MRAIHILLFTPAYSRFATPCKNKATEIKVVFRLRFFGAFATDAGAC